MGYIKKYGESSSMYYTKLTTGVGGDGHYHISGRPYNANAILDTNYSSSGAFDFVNSSITIESKTVSPHFVYYGRDATDNTWAGAVGPTLTRYLGTGSWGANSVSLISCPYSGSDYKAASLGQYVTGVHSCSNVAIGNSASDDVVIEALIRVGNMYDGTFIGKYDGSANPAAGAGWHFYNFNANLNHIRFHAGGKQAYSAFQDTIPGMWAHCVAIVDAGNTMTVYMNGASGPAATAPATLDSDFPMVVGGYYSATAPRRVGSAIAYVAMWRSPDWLDGSAYTDWIDARYAQLLETKLNSVNSSISYSIIRNVPVINSSTGETYAVNCLAGNSTHIFSSNPLLENLLPRSQVFLGANWTTGDAGCNVYPCIASEWYGPKGIGGQSSAVVANAKISSAPCSINTNFSGLSGTCSTLSFWVHYSACKELKVVINDDDSNSHVAWINTYDGTNINATANCNVVISSLLNGWKRVAITKPNLGDGKSVEFHLAQAGSTDVSINSGIYATYFWAMQMKNGADSDDDIPYTVGTPVSSGSYSDYVLYTIDSIGSAGGTIVANVGQQSVMFPCNIVSLYDSTNSSNSTCIYVDSNEDTIASIAGNAYSNFGDLSGESHMVSIAYFPGMSVSGIDGVYTSGSAPESLPSGMNSVKIAGPVSSVKVYGLATMGQP